MTKRQFNLTIIFDDGYSGAVLDDGEASSDYSPSWEGTSDWISEQLCDLWDQHWAPIAKMRRAQLRKGPDLGE